MATAAELRTIDADLAGSVRARIREAGYIVTKLHRVLAPIDTGGEAEALFIGHELALQHRGTLSRPLTAFVPENENEAVICLESW